MTDTENAMEAGESLAEVFAAKASAHPDRRFLAFIDDAGQEHEASYRDFDRAARQVARQLLSRGQAGDRVVVAFETGFDFLAAFWGALYAGMTAVPADPPSEDRGGHQLERLAAIVEDSGATQCLASHASVELARSLRIPLHWVPMSWPDLLALPDAPEPGLPLRCRDDLVALLYTSGSTGTPKGAMITGAPIVRGSKGEFWERARVVDDRPQEFAVVSFNSMTHAAGFSIALWCALNPTLKFVSMSPRAFVQSPVNWLRAISQHSKAGFKVVASAPNFALDLSVAAVSPSDLRELDLSGWKLVYSTGERIRPDSWKAFQETFEPCGFKPAQFIARYASTEAGIIAESTNGRALRLNRNALDAGVLEPDPDGPIELQSSGPPNPLAKAIVVDPETREPVAAGRIGEIWTTPSARGYWRRPEESEQAFNARTSDGAGPYFRTGDLGGVHDGELFVTGRLKDVIVVRGHKHHAEDIEATLERHLEWLPVNSAIAFSDDVGGERFFVAVDPSPGARDFESLGDAVRAVIARDHAIRVDEVLFVTEGDLPRTRSGKVSRATCRQLYRAGELPLRGRYGAAAVAEQRLPVAAFGSLTATDDQRARIAVAVQALLANVMNLGAADLPFDKSFRELGVDSASGVRFTSELQRWAGRSLPKTLLYNYPTIHDVARFLSDGIASGAASRERTASAVESTEGIAIVGVGCRMPGGASSFETFWRLIEDGVDAIGVPPAERRSYFRAADMRGLEGGFLHNIEDFDPGYFAISKREAETMDPLHRILLEVTAESLHDAGVRYDELRGSATGVFVGVAGGSGYDQGAVETDAYAATATSISVASGRLAYFLDALGPCMTIDTACSSSLVAVHLASQSLRSGETNLAIAGGITLMANLGGTVAMKAAGALSPDMRCKTFDASANGYVRSEGCGLVVLKRLSDARRDGDRIFGVIRGSAMASDGRSNGLTAPSGIAQQRLLRAALAAAGVESRDVAYLEAHGTGTPLGDPIELEAISAVYADERAGQPLIVGSVKANIGHTEAAAGFAGLLKVLGMFRHGVIPRQLHLTEPTPLVSWAGLEAPRANQPWRSADKPRLAGVSSFGFSGTIAHCIVEEPPPPVPKTAPHLGRATALPLSAKTPAALKARAATIATYLDEGGALDAMRDIAFTASVRQNHDSHRLTVVGDTHLSWRDKLRAYAARQTRVGLREGAVAERGAIPRVAFVFSGQGPQWWAMGQQLAKSEPRFRQALEECDRVIIEAGGPSVLAELSRGEAESRVSHTEIAQPALFALQVALSALFRQWGVEPSAVVGHSVGEIAAAHVAGVLSLGDAARLAAHRGRIMQKATGRGRMASVALSLVDATRMIADYGGRISIGAANSPTATVLSGEPAALEQLVAVLATQLVETKWLRGDYAFHSSQMAGYGPELREQVRDLIPNDARVPFVSTVTGSELSGRSLDADYWSKQIQNPVLLAPAIEALATANCTLFLEIGPHPVLASAIVETLGAARRPARVVASLRRGEDELATVLDTVSALYVDGYPVEWARQYPTGGSVVSLPAYPWQRERCWRNPVPRARQRRQVRIAGMDVEAHPFLASHVALANPTTHVWETSLDLEQLAYLTDHQVQGSVVFPGAAFAEVAFAAGKEVFAAALDGVADLQLVQPLVLRAQEATILQCRIELPARDTSVPAKVTISSRPPSTDDRAGSVTVHATATLALRADDAIRRASALEAPDDVVRRCSETVPANAVYEEAARGGIRWGAQFRNLHQIWRRNGEAIATLALAPEVTAALSEYHVHPALLDAAFQILGSAAPNASSSPRIPVGLSSLRCTTADLHAAAWVRAVVAEAPSSGAATTVGDVFVLDRAGTVLVEARGIRLQAIERRADYAIDASLFELAWRPREDLPGASEPPGRGFLVFLDESGVGSRVAAKLEARGGRVCTVRRGGSYATLGARAFQLDPLQPEHFVRLLREHAVATAVASGDIVQLWSLDGVASDIATIHESLRDGTIATLHLVQALAREAVVQTSPPRLWLLSRGAQPVGGGPVAVAQSPMWGFGATIANELAELRCTLVDLDPAADDVERVLAELGAAESEPRVAFRGGKRYVQRVVRRERRVALQDQAKTQFVVGAQGYRLELGVRSMVDSLTLVGSERKQPGPREVEIAVKATGVNFRDVLMAIGAYPDTGDARLPMGSECAGIVAAVGRDVRTLRIGDAVMASCVHAFDSHVVVDAERARLKPVGLSFEAAAGSFVVFETVYQALHEVGRLRRGEKILIHSAAGGIGLAAIQYAKHVGAEILATAGTQEKRELLHSMGIEHVMSSRSLGWADEVMRLTDGRGVDVVLNSLAGENIPSGIGVLAPFGRFLELGKRDVYADAQVGLYGFRNNITVSVIALDQLELVRPDEARELRARVQELFDRDVFRPLPRETFAISKVVDAFRRLMAGTHVGKVVVTAEDTVAVVAAPCAIHEDGTYVLTGGLAGIGLLVAESLASRGARHLALLGRSAPSEPTQAVLRALRAQGVEIEVFAADVGDHAQLASVFAQIDRAMPRIRGVVHSAGVVDDGTIATLDAAKFLGPVAKAKIDGGWHLHQLTKAIPLDFFVLFSSTAPIQSAGQGNYAAANAFLDALAHHRRASGLPATSINWGPWSGTGMDRRRASAARPSQDVGMSSAEGLAFFHHILDSDAAQVAVIGRQGLSQGKGLLFEEVHRGIPSDGQLQANSFHVELAATPPEARFDAVQAALRALIADSLRADSTAVDANAALTSLGLDSLMAIELRARIRERMAVAVSAMDIAANATLKGLARFVLSKLSGTAAADNELYKGVLKVLQSGGTAPALRLVCFPPAGSEPDEFRRWLPLLPEGIELCAVAYPGVGVRAREPVGSLAELARDVAESLVSRPAAPLAFFGHSLGVVVALATSAELRRRGMTPSSIALSAVAPMDRDYRFDPATSAGRTGLLDLMRTIDMNTDSLMTDSEAARHFLAVFAAQLAWLADLPSEIEQSCPVAVFAADRDVSSAPANLASWTKRLGGPSIYRFDGDHNYIQAEARAVLARVLELNRSDAANTESATPRI